MNTLVSTRHATRRMAQRSIRMNDIELIRLIGTEVDDGYLVLAKDCQEAERELKRLIERVRRIRGKRLVVANGHIVTAYRASRSNQRRLLRSALESDLGFHFWSADKVRLRTVRKFSKREIEGQDDRLP